MHNEIIEKLNKFSDPIEWERLCCDILSKMDYRGIEPQSVGGKDGGKDAIIWNDSLGNIVAHFSLRKDWKKKLYEDLEKTKGKSYGKIIFCSNQLIQGPTKDKVRKVVEEKYGAKLDIFDQERLRVDIENNRPDLLRKLGLLNLQILIENADLLSLSTKEKPKKLEILQKYLNENLDSSDKVTIKNVNGTPQVSINEFLELIKINTRFKIKNERLDGYKNIMEYIKSKTSEGEDLIFSEDEIEYFYIDHPYKKIPVGKLKTLKISASAEPTNKEIYVDIETIDSDIKYERIKIALISRKDEYDVFKSFGSDVTLISKMYKPWGKGSKVDIKFKLNEECNDLYQGIKFNKFMRDLSKSGVLIIRENSNKKILLNGNPPIEYEVNEGWLNLLDDLYKIGQKLNIVFPLPRSVTPDEVTVISLTINAINSKKLEGSFNGMDIESEKDKILPLLIDYEKNGYIEGVTLTFGSINGKLLGQEINLGKGIAKLPPLKFNTNIEGIKEKLLKEGKLKLKLSPFKENESIEFALSELDDSP